MSKGIIQQYPNNNLWVDPSLVPMDKIYLSEPQLTSVLYRKKANVTSLYLDGHEQIPALHGSQHQASGVCLYLMLFPSYMTFVKPFPFIRASICSGGNNGLGYSNQLCVIYFRSPYAPSLFISRGPLFSFYFLFVHFLSVNFDL